MSSLCRGHANLPQALPRPKITIKVLGLIYIRNLPNLADVHNVHSVKRIVQQIGMKIMVIVLIKGMNVRDIVQEIKKTGQWLYPTARVSGCALAGNSVLGRAALAIPTLPA